MLCKKCMIIMETGTTFERRKDGKHLTKRFHECRKCHNKVYAKEPSFVEYMSKVADRCRNV